MLLWEFFFCFVFLYFTGVKCGEVSDRKKKRGSGKKKARVFFSLHGINQNIAINQEMQHSNINIYGIPVKECFYMSSLNKYKPIKPFNT